MVVHRAVADKGQDQTVVHRAVADKGKDQTELGTELLASEQLRVADVHWV